MKHLSIVFILVLGISAFGQAKKPLPKTGTPAVKPAPAPVSESAKTSTVQIIASLILKDGENVPVASNTFYLLSEDLSKVLNTPKMKELLLDDVQYSDYDSLPEFAIPELKKEDLATVLGRTQLGSFPTYTAAVKAEIAKAIKYQTISDAQGRAEFKDLPRGNYFLYGEFRIKNAFGTWYTPVNANGELTKVVLDLNNRLIK